MKIISIWNSFDRFPKGVLPLNEYVIIKYENEEILVQIGELGLYIGDEVKFEKGTKEEFVVRK